MKKAVFAIFMGLLIANGAEAQRVKTLNINANDDLIHLSQVADEKELLGQGPVECGYAFSDAVYPEESLVVRSTDMQKAGRNLILLCVKRRCQNIGQALLRSMEESQQVSDADFTELLKAQGYPSEKIALFLQRRKNLSTSGLAQTTCQNGSDTLRATVISSCLTIPVSCTP